MFVFHTSSMEDLCGSIMEFSRSEDICLQTYQGHVGLSLKLPVSKAVIISLMAILMRDTKCCKTECRTRLFCYWLFPWHHESWDDAKQKLTAVWHCFFISFFKTVFLRQAEEHKHALSLEIAAAASPEPRTWWAQICRVLVRQSVSVCRQDSVGMLRAAGLREQPGNKMPCQWKPGVMRCMAEAQGTCIPPPLASDGVPVAFTYCQAFQMGPTSLNGNGMWWHSISGLLILPALLFEQKRDSEGELLQFCCDLMGIADLQNSGTWNLTRSYICSISCRWWKWCWPYWTPLQEVIHDHLTTEA